MHDNDDFFQRRWNEMVSADMAHGASEMAALRAQVVALEKLVVYLGAKLALGESPGPDDATLRDFLHIGEGRDGRRALLELVAQLQPTQAVRIVTCPGCGAGVKDLPGVHDERCQFCGATVFTTR